MDSLTQIVLGAAVGEAVLGKKIGNRAILWGAIGGTIPDLDVLANFFTDPINADYIHRGFSHSLVFSLLMAPVLGWIVHEIHKKREADFRGWTLLFFAALVTHPLLDCHTDYGTQFFWPFEYRVAYKNIAVIDPFYTIPFLILVATAMFFKRQNPIRTKLNYAGIIISSLYMVFSIVSKVIGWKAFESDLKKQNIEYVELDTRPTPMNAILWNAQIETENGFRTAYYSLFDSKEIEFSKEFPKNYNLLKPYEGEDVVKKVVQMARGWYFMETKDSTLYFNDLRFGQFGFDVNESPFAMRYKLKVTESGNVQITKPDFSDLKEGEFSNFFSNLTKRVKGN
jgi:inner membrane protein